MNWANTGGTREALDALITEAQDWKAPPTKEGEQQAATREDELLAALDRAQGLDRARKRKEAAKILGVTGPEIDAELRARHEAAPLYGHWIVEPWPDPVEGDSLLRDLIRRIHRHVVCVPEVSLTSALWVLFSWVHDEAAVHSPMLLVTSAEAECGKTTLLNLVSYWMPRAIASVEISRAALFRAIKLWSPSFAIDEFDDVLKATGDSEKAELRSVINSGHTRGSGVLRCVGDEKTPELFPTFAPKALGMVGRKLPVTTLGRCIVVELRRRAKDERIDEFAHKDDSELESQRSRLLRWSMDNVDAFTTGGLIIGGCCLQLRISAPVLRILVIRLASLPSSLRVHLTPAASASVCWPTSSASSMKTSARRSCRRRW